MKRLLKTLLLVCVLTASLSPNLAHSAEVPVVAITRSCAHDDLVCFRLLLLDKQDEVVSLGKQLGFRENQVKLLEESVQLVTDQRNLMASSLKTLSDSASKLIPHWYQSPVLWAIVGFVAGVGVAVLTVWGVGQALLH